MFNPLLEQKKAIEKAVVSALIEGEISGMDLYSKALSALAAERLGTVPTALFYTFLGEMEQRGLISHEVKQKEGAGGPQPEWWFKLAGQGTPLAKQDLKGNLPPAGKIHEDLPE
jgi:hypothetical protein